MKTPFLLVALVLLAASHASAYEITGTAVSHDHNLVRTEYVVQAGPTLLDKFKMTRLVKDVPQDQLRGSIFFFFPLGTTFSFYEQRDPNELRRSAREIDRIIVPGGAAYRFDAPAATAPAVPAASIEPKR